MKLTANKVIAESGVVFGTSGARGLVEDFTPNVCSAFAIAFIDGLQSQFTFKTVAIAIDNRPSSYAMAQACANALALKGIDVLYFGVIPTPALAYSAMKRNIPCIMVTGSHIPFDRNGLKFYRPDGEITKADEQAILNSDTSLDVAPAVLPELTVDDTAKIEYEQRYTSLFSNALLQGKKIGIYEHSSAGRDIYSTLFKNLGAEVTALERSDEFVPIDTEAVSKEDQVKARAWSDEYGFDAIFSTDGDGDRPLIADENGEWLRGDILGLLCSQALNIEALAIPVSCNTSVELSELFKHVARTKIGSPYVIAEFESLANGFSSFAGFEANGGFLLGSDVSINENVLSALPTRDAVLPAIQLLALSVSKNVSISALVNACSTRFSASDRIKNFATEKSKAIIAQYAEEPNVLIGKLGVSEMSVVKTDLTDGLRMTLSNDDIVHLRPSGNAPELRCYAESNTYSHAEVLVNTALSNVINI